MPKQLRVLLLIFTVFVIIFLIVRRLLIPDSFGEFGHYRGDALIENADKEMIYAGKAACIDCHSDINDMLLSDMHVNLSCEGCHGPGMKHADSMETSDIIKNGTREHCGRCHAIIPARQSSVITQINIKEHYIEIDKCIECHNPHQVWEIKEWEIKE